MKRVNLNEAKTNLSKLVDLAMQGEDIVICKAGNPVARLVPIRQSKKKRRPGVWTGKVTIKKDFDVLPDDFMGYFK